MNYHIFYFQSAYNPLRIFGIFTKPDASQLPQECLKMIHESEGFLKTKTIKNNYTPRPNAKWPFYNRNDIPLGVYLIYQVPLNSYIGEIDYLSKLIGITTSEKDLENLSNSEDFFYFLDVIREDKWVK